ncbi:uracil-xanthine permease family protein [Porphyromonas sp.]|uniref:uracil-xanthine permease family protein n=1 Tax=Porphyromonas sp. TaxID=1924944 RepID=UPI0026DCEE47|nr:solute carrier family 23 protein [Porphyromonas sp.]MDO4770874.1 solute carrier family 23 protein [Porphyromonas sp.]
MADKGSNRKFRYELDEKPGWLPLMLYGVQWFLVTVPVLIIIGSLVGEMQFDTVVEKTFYTQKLFALVGIALIVQLLWGHKLPIVIGPATVLVVGIIASQSQSIPSIYTAIITGGALLFLLSFTPRLRHLKDIFTPRIVVVILALIAITLMPTIIELSFSGGLSPDIKYIFFLSLSVALIIGNYLLKGIWKSTILLWGIIIGTLTHRLLSSDWSLPTLPSNEAASPSFFIPAIEFDAGVLLAFLFCYVALLINELGSVQAVSQAINSGGETQRTIKGLRFVGIFNAINGLFGVIGPVDFSMSPGIIMNTRCASRYTLIPAGIGLILCAIFPQAILFLTTIPEAVMGIILLYLMATQLGSALQMISVQSLIQTFDHAIIIAVPIMMALFTVFLPEEVVTAIPQILRPILANGFVVGILFVILLEHLFNRKRTPLNNTK